MKVVYMVESGSYSGYSVDGLFSSEENAQLFIDKFQGDNYDEMKIREVELDKFINEIKEGYSSFRVYIDRSNNCQVRNERDTPSTYISYSKYADYFMVLCHAKDENHAAKIAAEKLRPVLAANAWGDYEYLNKLRG